MGLKGDFFELIDGAPHNLLSLRGSLWKWRHHDRRRRAVEQMARRGGGSVSRFGGEPDTETTDEHLRLWLGATHRWRIESDSRIDVKDGHTRWIGGLSHVVEDDDDTSSLDDTEVGILLRPGFHLLGLLHFDFPIETEVDGRRCLKVDATTDLSHRFPRPMALGMRLGGIDHQFWFDLDTGIILRHVGLVDGDPCAISEFKDLVINERIPDEDFAFIPPPDATVERRIDQLLRTAEMRGADLADVDTGDPAAVQAAIHSTMNPGQPAPEVVIEKRRAKHVPMGDPPEDEATARTSIEYAYSHHAEVDASGANLVNVQMGSGLAGPLGQAARRIPGNPSGTPKIVVDDIKFLRPDEAVVWFSVEVDGNRLQFVNGREGRAVLVGDRWLVEHATLADLLGMAAVQVPPPSA
jgi:hypothetical protein